jgi:lysophospholipase L1-like esterase
MADNQVDGYPGATISEIHSKPGVDASLKQKPNVVLVLAGTNDAVRRQNEAPTTVASK